MKSLPLPPPPFEKLTKAVGRGKLDEVKTLLTQGANPNSHDPHGNPPILIATENGNEAMVLLLLSHKADPNAKNAKGLTAIHSAATQGNLPILIALIKKGASIDSPCGEGLTPLMYAAINDKRGYTLPPLIKHGATLEFRQQDEDFTALMWAQIAGNGSAMDILVEAGAKLSKTDMAIYNMAEQKTKLLYPSQS